MSEFAKGTGSLFLVAATLTLAGCGAGSPSCTTQLVTSVGPTDAVADHTVKAPGDQQTFQAVGIYKASGTGCAVPALAVLYKADWTVSDSLNVQISSAKDSTNGLATCLGPTAGPVTVTATAGDGSQTASASLTCK